MTAPPVDRPPPAETAERAATAVPAWALWTLRISTAAIAVLVFLQPVFAGLFITGDVGILRLHSAMADIITVLTLFQILAAILLWWPARGAAWPMWACTGFFLAAGFQTGLGHGRVIAAHIPTGVLVFGFAIVLALASWSPRLRVRRPRRARQGVGR